MNLFEAGTFTGASGKKLDFKLECDALTEEDIKTIAGVAGPKLQFKEALGVPRGGVPIANEFTPYVDSKSKKVLLVDDVWTTGFSMNKYREELGLSEDEVIGFVIFARGAYPDWVHPFFAMPKWIQG